MINPCPSLLHQLSPPSMVPPPPVHTATRVLRYVSLCTVVHVPTLTQCLVFFFKVTIHAPIYFYQFSHAANASDLLWTGRFAIAFPNGTTVAAPNITQPDGENIPWGNGALVSGSNSTASSSSVPTSSQSPVAAVPTATDATTPSTTGSPSAANSTDNANSSSSNGALMLGALSARGAQAGVALAVIACAFTVMV